MKTFCFECKHDCHCGRKCNQCSCYICNNILIKTYEDYLGGNMLDRIKSRGLHVWQNHKVCVIIIAELVVAYMVK